MSDTMDEREDDEADPWSLADELRERGGWVDPDPTADSRAELVNELQAILDDAKEQAKRLEQHAIESIADACNRLGKQVFDQLKAMGRAINAQADVIDSVRQDLARLKAGPPELGELPPWAVAFRERLLAEVATIWTNGSNTLAECLRAEMQNQGQCLAGMIDTLTTNLRKAFDLIGQQADVIAQVLAQVQELRIEVTELRAKQP